MASHNLPIFTTADFSIDLRCVKSIVRLNSKLYVYLCENPNLLHDGFPIRQEEAWRFVCHYFAFNGMNVPETYRDLQ